VVLGIVLGIILCASDDVELGEEEGVSPGEELKNSEGFSLAEASVLPTVKYSAKLCRCWGNGWTTSTRLCRWRKAGTDTWYFTDCWQGATRIVMGTTDGMFLETDGGDDGPNEGPYGLMADVARKIRLDY
jgi:hypothetical protein